MVSITKTIYYCKHCGGDYNIKQHSLSCCNHRKIHYYPDLKEGGSVVIPNWECLECNEKHLETIDALNCCGDKKHYSKTIYYCDQCTNAYDTEDEAYYCCTMREPNFDIFNGVDL